MDDLTCYFNGEYIKTSEAKVHISDWGLWEGSVYDVLRTYNHIPFKVKEHIDRFFKSVRSLPFIQFNMTPEEVIDCIHEVIERNMKFVDPLDDLRVIFRLSKGIWTNDMVTTPTFYIYAEKFSDYKGNHAAAYGRMAKLYRDGAHLVTVNTRQIPPSCLDVGIKNSNRLCNSLAKYEASLVDPEACPVMFDINGFVSESAIDNLFLVRNGTVYTPKLNNCLEGISRQTVVELCHNLGIKIVEGDLTSIDLYNAQEMMITSTNYAIAPVSRLNTKPLTPVPGVVTKRLQDAFSELVNYDIVQRATNYAEAAIQAG